jgi:hypothetical protein
MAKLADALNEHKLGMRLIICGIVLVVAGTPVGMVHQ